MNRWWLTYDFLVCILLGKCPHERIERLIRVDLVHMTEGGAFLGKDYSCVLCDKRWSFRK